MNSDNSVKQPDAKWRHAGPGMSSLFRCALCGQARVTLGRKLQPVLGLRQWVCKGCAR
jgi:hypothetical protein